MFCIVLSYLQRLVCKCLYCSKLVCSSETLPARWRQSHRGLWLYFQLL